MKYPCLLTKKISEISGAKYNPRKISDEAMGRLTKSLAEFGNIQPITWNARTGNVVGGHQRLKVYKAMGKTEVDVWAVDLDEQKEKAANIALNKLSGEFDMPMLKDILEEIDTGDLDMEITGFGMDEIALMMEDAHPEVTEDEVPEVPVDSITKPGDLWILGEHRVLCGDATSGNDVEKLMNSEKADMVFTDPPYNTGMTAQTQSGGNPNTPWKGNGKKTMTQPWLSHMFNDAFTDEQWQNLLASFCKHYFNILKDDSVAYICLDWRRNHELIPHIKQYFKLSNIIVWDKMVHGLGSDYKYTYELINICKKGNPKLETHQGEREYSDVWHIQRKMGRDEDHATKKPVELTSRSIRHGSSKNNIISDFFLGSGTTLIAAEQLGRKCYGMEISPNYCDVIVKRWENLTGKKATLAK
jgi:DNA modification methylase